MDEKFAFATAALADTPQLNIPSPTKIAVILNACAGNGYTHEWSSSLTAKFAACALEASITLAKDGSELAAATQHAVAQGFAIVVAGGGDGTINAVASALIGTEAALGILPLGTLNHFAKDVGIPLDIDEAIRTIGAGRRTKVDTAQVNGRIFLNNSSLGLYPDTVRYRERQQRQHGRGKWLSFFWAALVSLRRYLFLHVTLSVDNKRGYRQRTPFIFIGNNPYVMQGFNMGARAQLDSGRLSLYYAKGTSRLGLLVLLARAILGRLRQAKDFEALSATCLSIESRHPQLRVSTDGEVNPMRTPLKYQIYPASLNVLVPQAATQA